MMAGNEGKSCNIVSKGSLANSSYFTNDSSTLCIKALSPRKILVGGENGCYLSYLDAKKSHEVEEVTLFHKQEVQSVSSCGWDIEHIIFVANGKDIHLLDQRLSLDKSIHCFSENTDEINQIKCSEDKEYLISCDDSGECKIYDLKANKLYRTLRRRHNNICSTFSFLQSNDEIITGGLDSQIIHWNFKRVKVLQTLNTQSILKAMGDDSVYMFNPPLVHSLDVSKSGKLLASGLGNGSLQIFNICKGKYKLVPSLLINHHSTLGISHVHFADVTNGMQPNILLSGGNDGALNLWEFPIQENKKKIPMNYLCSDEEKNTYFHQSYNMNSKINFVETVIINNKTNAFVADQTPYVKHFEIEIPET